jgi:hypothetical protein
MTSSCLHNDIMIVARKETRTVSVEVDDYIVVLIEKGFERRMRRYVNEFGHL